MRRGGGEALEVGGQSVEVSSAKEASIVGLPRADGGEPPHRSIGMRPERDKRKAWGMMGTEATPSPREGSAWRME